MIRICTDRDLDSILEIINDGAQAYRGIIPQDRWHEPYMARRELSREIEDGVVFYGYEEEDFLAGVMGIQDRCDVSLIRHAYVRTARRNHGIGSRLLDFLQSTTDKPLLVGTWAAATWAIAFYQKKGYRVLPPHQKDHLLKKYWNIPQRQVDTSVVLAGPGWPQP
ncbi:MAG: putative acetyltransferase [Syntrophorhabdus sp. PtaB.Bin184]|jgi:GNAT superfamily N-acetyltransferase|nr:MAG: putative acetyltransferase [Syntrophorhabdus sp. PtaB.Bin184]